MGRQILVHFFHGAGHILNDGKKQRHVDDGASYADALAERQASAFASEILIPREHDRRLAASLSAADIERIADELEVCPGIVAGRFQHLTGK
ncbi:MAG: ImmA/IrrE family metallo-endopeptidase [Verrucomicrobiales bacterium]|nr:ImmA/IrrE family metallo-endopeptidase [Verrucomicrobiales bacterium]MCP5525612.1 ImmA/IrrE family metallo-endopeptidase [Verrucomicrobiales bacterium]